MNETKGEVIERALGAVRNPDDNRDIKLSRVQAPVALPLNYKTDIDRLLRRDQKFKGRCVGEAGANLVDFFNLIENGVLSGAAARGIYALCKARDNYLGEGTYPRILAKVLTDIGAPTTKIMSDDPDIPEPQHSTIPETPELLRDAFPFRVGKNYAWPDANVESLKQAVYQNKVILASIEVGNEYEGGHITPFNSRGLHYILIYGFETLDNGTTKFLFLNSWSKFWGINGTGYFLWSEMQGHIYDILAFVDIPNEILEEAHTTYKFLNNLKPGSTGPEVVELQLRLALEPALDGLPCFRNAETYPKYGPATTAAVQRYQAKKGIISSGPISSGYGQLGPRTRKALNESTPPQTPKVEETENNTFMTTETKRHLKSSAALIGTGAIVLPLLGTLLEGLMEVMNQPQFADQINAWFGVGSLASLLVLTLAFRLVAWALNAIAERQNREKGIASINRNDSVSVKI